MLQIKIFKIGKATEAEINEFIAAHKITRDLTITEEEIIFWYNDSPEIGLIKDGLLNHLNGELKKLQAKLIEAEFWYRFWEPKLTAPHKPGDPDTRQVREGYESARDSIRINREQVELYRQVMKEVEDGTITA